MMPKYGHKHGERGFDTPTQKKLGHGYGYGIT